MSKYNNLKAKVVGISVDQPFSLAQFAKENNLKFDLLSDATREVSKKYDIATDLAMEMEKVDLAISIAERMTKAQSK